jgi:hypothetical protein
MSKKLWFYPMFGKTFILDCLPRQPRQVEFVEIHNNEISYKIKEYPKLICSSNKKNFFNTKEEADAQYAKEVNNFIEWCDEQRNDAIKQFKEYHGINDE